MLNQFCLCPPDVAIVKCNGKFILWYNPQKHQKYSFGGHLSYALMNDCTDTDPKMFNTL